MTLLELTEPAFQYVCRLNRVARKGASIDYQTVRSDVRELFAQMQENSRADLSLAQQYQKIELALTFFVDSLISESRLHFAMEWNNNRLAFESQHMAGDDEFFDLLEATLAERGDEAAERLAVFYTCLGLGFTGSFAGQHAQLKRKMADIAQRIRGYIESDESSRICPDAYEHTLTIDLPRPVRTRLTPCFIGIGVLIFAVGVIYWDRFRSAAHDLHLALDDIAQHDPAGPEGRR